MYGSWTLLCGAHKLLPTLSFQFLCIQCKPTTSRLSSGEEPVDSRRTLIRGGAVSTRITLSSGEEPCGLMSHSHPGRSRVDSRHTLIRGGAVLTHVTLSSGEEQC